MTYTLSESISYTFTAFFGGWSLGMLFFWSCYFLRFLLGLSKSIRNGDIVL